MKPTRAINATGNPNWRFVPLKHSNVRNTIQRWMRDYANAWDEAHVENERRDKAVQNVESITKKRVK